MGCGPLVGKEIDFVCLATSIFLLMREKRTENIRMYTI